MASMQSSPSTEEQASSEIDDLYLSLQEQREFTQKKTFTSWINSILAKHTPPSVISDLYTDIQQGHLLLDLLEVLSGQHLPREKGFNTFQCRSNIENALTFLKSRSLKLINIHVADIIEGNPSIVLGLIWTIIFHFHIEELARTLACTYNQPSLGCSSAVDSSPKASRSAKKSAKIKERWKISATKALLLWAKEQCSLHGSINVTDFKSSWRSGLPFLAIIQTLRPGLVDLEKAKTRSNKENLKEAFRIAELELNIPRLLEPEDVDIMNPDEKSIMTYVAQFLQYSRNLRESEEDMQEKVRKAVSWLAAQEKKLTKLLMDTENETYYQKCKDMMSFMEVFNQEKNPFLHVLSSKRSEAELSEGHQKMREEWDKLISQINEWKVKLDQMLPSPLDSIEAWLQEVEHLQAEDLPDLQDPFKAMFVFREIIVIFKGLMDCFDSHLDTLQSFKNEDEKNMPLVLPEKLEEMKRRFSNISTNSNTFLEYHYGLCSAIANEVNIKLNIWDVKYGTKESVESLLENWNNFIEETRLETQLETATHICEDLKNKNISNPDLAGDPQEISKLLKTVESKISMCRDYISNVNTTLQKVLSSWSNYTENIHLLKTWLEEKRNEHPKEIPAEILAKWNSVHGSLNEAGNYLIEVSKEQIGSNIAKELKKLNRRWAKFIKRTHFLGEESTDAAEKTRELPGCLEKVEELLGGVDSWAAETGCLLSETGHEGPVEPEMEERLQSLAARGTSCQEQLVAAEEILQSLTQNVSSQVSQQHSHTTGLQARIKEARDKIEAVTGDISNILSKSEKRPSEETLLNFEESQKELEASISKAVQLVSQKLSPEECISRYEEAFNALDNKVLDRFLKAAEKLKNISSDCEKLVVEEKSKDVRKRWEAVHHEIMSYVQLIVEREKKKFNATFKKINKQLGKEKKLLSMDKTKGLKEHKAFFSHEDSLKELSKSLEDLKILGRLSEETVPGIQALTADCEQKLEKLQQIVADTYTALLSRAGKEQSSVKESSIVASENGEKPGSSQQIGILSVQETSRPAADIVLEPDVKRHNGESCAKKFEEDSDLPIPALLESYNTQRSNLEELLQVSRDKVASGFTGEIKGTSCLQNKLLELQVIESETNSDWTQLENISSTLENLVDGVQQAAISDTRSKLKGERKELQDIISTRTNSLRTALEIVLPIENESILLCELDQRLKKKDIQQFNLMNSDLAYRELKELQRSILNQIEVCKQLEHLDSSARDEFNPIDLQAASKIMIYYQNQLEEMSHKMQIRETVLKDLEAFMASLRKIQSSIKCLTDHSGQPEIQGKALKEAAQEVSHMAEEAKCLDERLKTVDICLEDAECGRKTCCENLVLTLSEELSASYDPSREQMLTEENDLYKTFATKNGELLKNIQDLRDRINKIGLKDPTIPAIQQRVKSLMELEKELDCAAVEMKPMREIANKLPQIKEEEADEANEQCRVTERLWEDTKLLLAECQEQCARALELLKQYQSCKTSLTSIIQKQEIVLSQQTSYMGKENLNRLITKIEEAKEEFNDHSEDVDKINQICKNLQFQLNKMRSFEEPPFENEANIIVDRWLDINEKTENYCDNLGRAQALWDKLLNLSGTIDAWANAELKNAEDRCLTEEDLTQLKACLRVQEQKLQKFDNTVAEIEELLNSNEPPLELQVIRSSVVQKMELIKELLSTKRGTSELSVNTAELKGDLDLAKTQIGMTESLLKALSPSDTLEIFTKLEEIHQKILQQKHHVTLLQEETDCPDVDELNKQLKCVTDLFNKKKHVFQDHFIGVLNRQCKNFNDWFSSTQLSLKDCFDPSETKWILEERLQKLKHFLTSEGKDQDIQEVKTLLNKVKHYLPKASINHLNNRVRDQEAELQRLISKCQKREKELGASLQQLSSLEESRTVLEEWLTAQEEKLEEIKKDETKLENFYKTVLMQRKPFDSMAQLANSLREAGLTEDKTISEASDLINRYQALITHVSEMAGSTERLPVEGQNFEEVARDVSCWIKKLEEAVNNLSSQENELSSDERINKIKEITALKDAGEAKIQNMVALGETLLRNEEKKKPVVQQTISELQNQWESTCRLATEYRSPQEQLQFNRKQYERSKDLRLALTELEKQQQEIGFALQPGLQEKQAQLTNYADLLQKAEDLTSRFNELKSQEDHLQGHTGDPCFTEVEWLELKHQHENLLSQLQAIVQTLESHVQEHQQFQDMVAGLSTELKTISEKLADCEGPATEQPSAEQTQLKSQEQQAPLSRCEDTLKEILVLAETVKQNTSSPGLKFIKDEIETLQSEHRSLEERLENVKQKEENSFSEALELKDEFGNETQMEDKADTMLKREIWITSDTPVAAEESPIAVELKEPLEMRDGQDVNVNMSEKEKQNDPLLEESSVLSDSPLQGIHQSKDRLGQSLQGKADKESPGMDKHDRVQEDVLDNVVHGGEAELERHQDGVGVEGDETRKEARLAEKKPSNVKNQSYREDVEQVQQRVCQKSRVLKSAAAEKDGLESNTPVSAHEDTGAEVVVQKELFPRVHVNTEYFGEKQKVNELKNEVAELDMVLINEQLKELENLQTELETRKAKSLCHSQEAFPSATGSNRAELQTTERAVPCWDGLLQELDAVKAVKQQQCSLINDYQKNLSAAQSSMKNLSTEKDNIKMGPMNNTVLLEKIKACIESLRKERDGLNQLKTQQESLSQHLTCMDKVLTESQMRQLEQWWQHMEQTVQKKHDQVVAEIDEFNLLMNKVQDIQKLIEEQYLQAESYSSSEGKAKYPVLWTTKLQDIKHSLSLLKRRIELQMKRIWSDQEKVALENSIHDLQSKLEALSVQQAPREDVQMTGPALMKQEMMKRLKESISWVKDSLSSLDQKAALFPSDVKSQIRNCQLMSTEVLNREPVIVSLDYGLQHIVPSLNPEEISDMTFLLQTLQNSYKALVLKSAQRLQHLELQLEERQRLIAEVQKVHCQLRNAEMLARHDMNQTSTWSELINQQAILKEILKDVGEIEGLISSHCKESQVTAGELSLSEKLFLIDQLRSLKNRARRTQRQIQSKLHEIEKKIAVYREFAEGITSLQQDLNDLQYSEIHLEEDELLRAEQEVKDKCKALNEKVLAFQSNLSQIMKYKEIFDCVGLQWDSLQLDELQTKFFKIKNKIKGKIIHFDNVVREWDKIQALLNEIQTMTSAVRKEANILNNSSSSSPAKNLISAQILFQTVQQIMYLTQEVANQINKNEVFDAPFKEYKRKEIKSLEKDAEELNQFLHNLVSGLQCVNKEDIQNEVEHMFHVIKYIQLEVQQPLLIDIKIMQYEKMRWEAIQNMMQAKFAAIKCIMEKEKENQEDKSLAAGIETKLETLQDHEIQLKTDIAARVSALEEACKTDELYTKAVQQAASFLEDYEAQVQSAAAELGSSEEVCQTPQWKQEEFDSAKANIENLYSKLKNLVKPEDKIRLENTLTELVNRSLALREKAQRKEADEQRYFEKYKSYTKTKDKVCDSLNKLEKMLRQSLSQIPMSYKEALEHLEESKILVSNIDSAEDDLVKLRQVSGELMRLCRSDRALGRIVTVLWESWLGLLEVAKGLEINCEELKQEWKFINEELERETIILDKLQEEQPESLKEKEKATREELVELLDFVNSFEENVNQQQLLLLLLLHRTRNVLNTSENSEAEAALPALCEIKAMQDRCKKLYEKTKDHKDSVQAEIQERNKITEEISAVTNALQNAASALSEDAAGKAGQLEEVQSVIAKESQTLKDIMEKLRIKYSEMYKIVPAEIETQLEDCKKVLQDLEDKVSFEILQSSPQYVLKRKAETIDKGLQAIEKMLQQKSENVAKAKEVQKQIWDMLDLWHYKLNELDAEVHDIVEQDSCHAQELMDILVTPLQQYQQVSQLAERRTAILNKAANRMEEYDELLKNLKVWIENTSCLLRADVQNDFAKSLHKHTNDLQMALEDSEQKQNLLHSVYLELEELTPVFETDNVMQQLNEIDDQVATLQHEIAEILPQIQHVADELDAIESHVKVFEKDIAKMKTILSSEDLLEFSLKDQLKHGQVILDHVGPMQKTIVHILSYEEALQLPGVKMQPFSVFQRARQLLRELKKLEKITKEQNDLLEEALKKTEECEQEIEKLKQFLKNHLVEISHEGQPLAQKTHCPEGEMEAVKEEIIKLCQRREDILTGMKNSMSELRQRLQQEVPESGDEPTASVLTQSDLIGTDVSGQQLKKRGMMFLLPSLDEESEDSSFHSKGSTATEKDASFWPSEGDDERHKEDSATSWSSGTLSDGIIQDADEIMQSHSKHGEETSMQTLQSTEGPGTGDGSQAMSDKPPPVTNAIQCSRGKAEDSEEWVDGGRPEPETILQMCQAQVAELEQWLDKTKVSLGSDPQTPKMQEMVELQLADYQVLLSEIEQKVLSLLEDCGDSADYQQETEALSLKLKEVKCNLEKVQMMLQDKYNEEQIHNSEGIDPEPLEILHSNGFSTPQLALAEQPLSQHNDFQHAQDLKVKAAEQKSLIDFIESCVEKMQPQFDDSVTQKLESSNGESDPKSKQADPTLAPKDQTGNKWQYLQQELSSKMKSPLCQLVEPQITTKMNVLPRGTFTSAGTPTVEELKNYTVQLGDLSQEANVVHAQDNVAEEVSSNLDRKLFELLLAISRCLNNMEEMLNTSVLSTEEAAVQQALYETLSVELQKLHADLSDKKDDLLKSISCAGGSTDVFSECFNNLQARLEQTQAATASRSSSMKAGLDHNSNYQNETRLLYDKLTEKKASLQQCLNAIRGRSVSEQLQKTDACALELQSFENQVAKLRGHGERFQLPITLIQEAYKLEDVLDDMWEILKAKYVELNSPSISESQYEDLLHGFAELVAIGREKIAQDPKQLAKSKAALQSHLKNHKDFFHNLMTHMAFMQVFSKKVTPSILQKREEFWRELVNEVKLLEQKACQYGIHLESLLKEWMEFDDECLVINKELEALSSTLPSVNLVEETEERLMERIALLQQIKSSVDEKHARLYQMVKEGKKLLTAVNCLEIRSQIGKLEEQWLSLTKKVGHELHRLQTLLKLLVSYNRDSEELMKWLDSAQQRMNFWKEQSLNVSQDLPTIRDNINSLFTFSKEVDEKSSLKSSVVSTANQLFHVKQADTAALRSSLAKFEQKWGELMIQLPAIQEKLHQLQMEKLSSREAIAELMTWLDYVEQQQGHEEPINSQCSAAQVRSLLQKYKEYMMEMNFKQWMVDFVNQSLLQMSTCDVESKRYERTEFAECLGEMNLRWHRLQASLNRKIQDLEHILEDITENENKAQTLHNWLEAQSDRLRSLQTPASLISAQNTLDDCKELENQLTTKCKTLDEIKQSLALNGSAEQTPEALSLRIAELCETVDSIVRQVAQLKTSMQSILEQWRVYDEVYAEVSLMTTKYLYCIDQCKPSVVSLEALKHQVKTLQSLQDESENSEEIWAKLQAAASNLKRNCSPSFAEIIEQKCTEAHARWNSVNEDITDQLRAAQMTLQLWEPFDTLCTEAAAKLEQHKEQCTQLLDAHMPEDTTIETLKQRIQDIKNLQHGLENIAGCRTQISLLADQIKQQAGTAAQAILLEKLQPLQRASYFEKLLQRKLEEFEFNLLQLEDFKNCLETLEGQVKNCTDAFDSLRLEEETDNSELLMNHTLELAALSPSVESLNEASLKLPLSDFTLKKVQSLTRQWSQKTATALERCSVLEGTQNDEKKFFQKCENWMKFLEKMKEALKSNIPGRFEELQEQQRVYEMLQTEISINQQTFNSIIAKVLLSLESGEAEKRTEFISKLTLLKEQWQNVIRMVQQRKKDIDGLVSQWQLFKSSMRSLSRFLADTNSFLLAVKSQDCYSLYQLRNLIHCFKSKAVILQRWQAMYSLIIDVGEKLRTVSDPETNAVLQEELSQLQQSWGDTQVQLEKKKMQLSSTLQSWDCCEKQIKELESRLRELKEKVKDPLPVEHEELYKAKEHTKELEQSLADWAHNMKELRAMKVELAHCILTEDMMVLKEQVEHLHRQWEELCLRVSLRKQEIEDRLNAWIVFNEKNKELCSWLVQMESKVLQTADVSIEDMIDKLQKDCMEEINLFSENKLHLKQMGDQLIRASNKSRVAEIDDKLNKINDRWQHLFDVIGARVKKLKETFAFIQLLDKNMSNLRTWLARIESELSKPVVYDICDDQEIQKRLAEQQDLQRDIEQHTAGVESVFNICEVLLHDSDACANETECDSIQQTTRSLDRRWRNICAMSMERRMKIEETWRLWQRFLDDYSRFEDWLNSSERTAAKPNSSEVLYTHAKEELKKFEAFQRQIHERLTQLELINKQYRRLARENRTDSASKLKQMVHEGNQRWDNLQKRVAAILRRLKHFTNRRDEFEGTRESILVWLTEMDLQLTNVEHFSKSNFDDKMRQLNGFQQEITLNTNKIDQLIVFGEQLIQKSEPLDATLIEDELEELHRYCQEVFGRVARFHQRLTSRHPGLDDEKETSENETDPEDSREIQNDPWHKKAISEGPSSPQSLCHLMPPTQGHERSGCETPVSVDSIPLEWDHTGDVGGSSSHEDEEEATYYSALSDVEITENPEAYLKMTTKTLKASSGKSVSEAHPWHSPDSPVCRKHRYNQAEMVGNVLSGPETSTPYKPDYVKQLSSASSSSINKEKIMSANMNDEEPQDDQELVNIAAAEKQSGIIDRWELIQAQDLRNKLRMKQKLQQWQQLNSDLSDVSAWLDKTEEELKELQKVKPPTSMQELEQRVKKLKDMLKAFDNYKAVVLSVNMSSKEFQKADSTEFKELQNRLRKVNLHWEKATHALDNWRKSLQQALLHCQDFHDQSQKLILWLASADSRRNEAQITDPNADLNTILECQKELMQLEKELLEQQLKVNSLQELTAYLLLKFDGDYIEADEKVHVIGRKLKQLIEQVSHDLKTIQGNLDTRAFLLVPDDLDSGVYKPVTAKSSPAVKKIPARRTADGRNSSSTRGESHPQPIQAIPRSPSFFYRVLRAALPLQLFFLLLLLLACMIPSSEEDYSCAQANNFARSFYPMLRYTNGPPPT
ncbi:nesprin-2 isoform X1 [Grus americana]|nr:nesprin-2 isoform X1 [Grus americana]XP_054681926.1 nesprin-2 isoform X1 [Grus americana]XP_054681927.1 nesprin-2 isoform X1 [Grus americana]XP_054681928.1 nesprin-2 isoform X1 [Grus americana]XP_054681929.1 nesprin-2 isoform X1 [Grus americana]